MTDSTVQPRLNDKLKAFAHAATLSGNTSFSDAFAVATKSPTYGKVRQLRIFVDRCSIEAFDAEGKMVMTNLVFPTQPYDKLTLKGKGKATVYNLAK